MPNHIALRIDGDIAHVTLDRPEKLNSLSIDMLQELVRVAGELRRNRDIRAVVLSGNGDVFSSGIDVNALSGGVSALRYFLPIPFRGTNLFQEACWAWRRVPVPVVAVVHGRCYGAAIQLALAADFRFATPDCEFSVMEAKWGLVPDMSGSATLAEVVGIDRAKLLTMTADVVDGLTAERYGLITATAADPHAAALDLITRIGKRSPDAVAGAKRLLNAAFSSSPLHAFAIERRTQLRLLVGRNSAVARKAGMQKVLPKFGPRQLG